jgi:POT family proton-dependent oligopeptide transporter
LVAEPVGSGQLFGHPKGIYLVAGTEFWERFSFYGVLGLLVLYLTAAPAQNGFGWENAEALQLYGLYTGLIFAAPAVGGWLSSRYFGERSCIAVGGLIVVLGHLSLGGPAFVPLVIERVIGIPVHEILYSSGITLGKPLAPAGTWDQVAARLSELGFAGSDLERARWWAIFGYRAISATFLGGLVLIAIGTGLIKPTISSIVGKLYSADDARSEAGFTVFMVCVWLGALLANFVAGTLGEKVGWHFGFTSAAAGMALGMSVYFWRQRKFLGDVGKAPDRAAERSRHRAAAASLDEKRRLWAIAVMSLFTIGYAIAYYQMFGMLNLSVSHSTNRIVAGFEVPATWFLSISTAVFVLAAPLVSLVWQRLAKVGHGVDVVRKQVGGLSVMAVGYLFLIGAELERAGQSSGVAAIGWIVAAYILFGLGDILIWPPQLAAASRLAPARMASFVIGAWYVTVGIGSLVSGDIGALAARVGNLPILLGILIGCGLLAGLLLLLRVRLLRLMGEVAPLQ